MLFGKEKTPSGFILILKLSLCKGWGYPERGWGQSSERGCLPTPLTSRSPGLTHEQKLWDSVSQGQAFPMVHIINLLPSGPPRREPAAAPTAQRVPSAGKAVPGSSCPCMCWGLPGEQQPDLGQKQTADVLWGPRNHSLASGLPRGAILPPSLLFRAGDQLHELPAPSSSP